MDTSFIIVIAIIVLFILLCLSIIVLVLYSGLLHDIKVNYGQSHLTSLSFMYKVGSGPYKNSTEIFAEAAAIAPNLSPIGVYFDDPSKEENLRWLAGSVLESELDETTLKLFVDNGFKKCEIGEIKKCVWTKFPFAFTFSIPIAIYRVYPALISFIKAMKLEAHPMIEIYSKDFIHFFAITENREKFYIPDILNSKDNSFDPITSTENVVHTNKVRKTRCDIFDPDNKLFKESENSNKCDELADAGLLSPESYKNHFITEATVNEYLIETTSQNSGNAEVNSGIPEVINDASGVSSPLRDDLDSVVKVESDKDVTQAGDDVINDASSSRKSSRDSDLIKDYEVVEEISPSDDANKKFN